MPLFSGLFLKLYHSLSTPYESVSANADVGIIVKSITVTRRIDKIFLFFCFIITSNIKVRIKTVKFKIRSFLII